MSRSVFWRRPAMVMVAVVCAAAPCFAGWSWDLDYSPFLFGGGPVLDGPGSYWVRGDHGMSGAQVHISLSASASDDDAYHPETIASAWVQWTGTLDPGDDPSRYKFLWHYEAGVSGQSSLALKPGGHGHAFTWASAHLTASAVLGMPCDEVISDVITVVLAEPQATGVQTGVGATDDPDDIVWDPVQSGVWSAGISAGNGGMVDGEYIHPGRTVFLRSVMTSVASAEMQYGQSALAYAIAIPSNQPANVHTCVLR